MNSALSIRLSASGVIAISAQLKVDVNIFKLIHEYSKNKKNRILRKTSLFKFPDFKHKNEHGKENLGKLLIDIFEDFPVTENPSILNSYKNKNK
ncbi:hypothetical protein [Chryseobacterium sp. OSA05B]|uniref:hypothetical protein n=1 Tax=Chryseobacterium sp. OSA05B TaxID=2862650 RepID=UPI001CBA9B00|nr:hypothetical protein [Chryseobacterium sp. OSA05B]